MHILWQMTVVESLDEAVIHENVWPSRFMLELANVGDQLSVMRQKRQPGIDLGRHQCIANENLARLRSVDAAIVHLAAVVERQAIERAALVGQHLATLAIPARFRPCLLHELARYLLHPLRLDARHAASEQPRGFHQFRGEDPTAALASQARSGVNMKANAARTQVMIAL